MSSPTRNNKLSINAVFLALILISSIIVMLTVFFDGLSKKRAELVYTNYTNETNKYIEKNRIGLVQIFEDINTSTCPNGYCNRATQVETSNIISDELRDFSSTAFVALNAQKELILQRLSGDREILYAGDESTIKLKSLINGSVSKLDWAEYLYFYQGKEIVVPVKNSEGVIIGLLIRTVVAK